MNIINILNLEDLPLSDKKLLVDEAIDVVNERVLNKVLENLDNNQRDSLIKALEEENTDEVAAIIENANIDIIELIEEESEKLKKELEKEVVNEE